MNLTDVEKAVVELSSRHPGLTKEFLRTLLEASGWEGKHIKEAEVILTARLAMAQKQVGVYTADLPPTVNTSSTKGDFTFYHPDGTEEGELALPEVVEVKREEVAAVSLKEKSAIENLIHEAESPQVVEAVTVEKQEKDEWLTDRGSEVTSQVIPLTEESLVLRSDKPKRPASIMEIPDNLPLVPFESSPHVWSFGRYKDTFHRDQVEDLSPLVEPKKEVAATSPQVIEPSKTSVYQKEVPAPVQTLKATNIDTQEVEIDFEKTPITTGDESLVVLAGIMLLAIMLILGYMYSNGRL